jgi:hypothetical protein
MEVEKVIIMMRIEIFMCTKLFELMFIIAGFIQVYDDKVIINVI